jgi:hypothetical protein
VGTARRPRAHAGLTVLIAPHVGELPGRPASIAPERQVLQHRHWARTRELTPSRTPSWTGHRGGTTMQLASRLFPWAQGQRVGTPGRTPVTRRRRGGRPHPDQDDTGGPAQRLAPTTEGCLDSLARTHPALRLLLYAIQ